MLTHLYELVRQRAETYPTVVALGGQRRLGWKTVTSEELLGLADRLAGELAALGVGQGHRVVLWVPNQWLTSMYLFALWKLGAVVVPFDREMNPESAARILEAVEPRAIITGYGGRPAWAGRHRLTEWWEPGSRDGAAQAADSHAGARASGDALTPALSQGEREWDRPAQELAVVIFTSGTTGVPKGCTITHANLCSQVEALRYTIPLDASCRLASILPLSHLFELTVGLLYPLASGAAIHYIPSRRPQDILHVLREQRVTHMMAVPQLLTIMGSALDERLRERLPARAYRVLHRIAERRPMESRRRLFWPLHQRLGGELRIMVSGGAALPAETQRLWERLGVLVVQGYGTSECSPVISAGAADGSTPTGSVGKALRGVEVRLSPEGELQVRGPNVMRGYWKEPERTAEVLQDGWYSTGDLARIDPDGNIWLSGRAKDLIVLPSGLNVWPQDIEDVLRAQPAVKDAAIVAVPTAAGGARLHAYLLPAHAGDRAADLGAMVAACNGQLAQHQRLASASWWPESDFPRTSTLKVRRHLLPPPESVSVVKIDSVLAADDPVGQAVAEVAQVPAVQPEQTLGELGLDSMGLVALAVALEEKCSKVVADSDLRLEMTVAQVRTLLANAPERDAAQEAERRGGPAPNVEQPMWPYTWGRRFRFLSFPVDLLYRASVTRTIVLGREHLARLPSRVIFAGTHHSFADMPLVRHALWHSPARRFVRRLVIATAAGGFAEFRAHHWFGILALGLYPLQQHGERDVSLRGLVRLAEAGNGILIFPQGAHATPEEERADVPTVRFKPGIALLAEALDAAVVPFGLAGTEVMIPATLAGFEGRVVGGVPVEIKRGPLAIAFAAPVRLEPGESPEAFATRLQGICYPLTRRAEEAFAAERRAH
jgi:long-chain acyl-CoA synthetase